MDNLDAVRSIADKVSSWRATHTQGYVVSRGPERVPEVSELRASLMALGVKELKYFDEGLDCIQYAQAARAAVVLGWTGYIDLLQSRIGRDGYTNLNGILKTEFHAVYKRAGKIKDRDELIDHFDDSLLLEAGRKLKLYDKHVWKQLDAMRDERNNCAHVEEYAVTVRIALGFYAHLIQFLPYVL
jgi:hypothetical protein